MSFFAYYSSSKCLSNRPIKTEDGFVHIIQRDICKSVTYFRSRLIKEHKRWGFLFFFFLIFYAGKHILKRITTAFRSQCDIGVRPLYVRRAVSPLPGPGVHLENRLHTPIKLGETREKALIFTPVLRGHRSYF